MIPDERMAEIEKRCEAATDGPWEAEPSCAGGSYGWWVAGYDYGTYRDADFEREEDARFVAHARTDLPDLLTAYKALLAENERLRETIDSVRACGVSCIDCDDSMARAVEDTP